MKKEDVQNAQQASDSSENKGEGRDEQTSKTASVPDNRQNNIAHQAGLGRDRMTGIENLGGMSGRDDYAGSNGNDLSNRNLNASNDQ